MGMPRLPQNMPPDFYAMRVRVDYIGYPITSVWCDRRDRLVRYTYGEHHYAGPVAVQQERGYWRFFPPVLEKQTDWDDIGRFHETSERTDAMGLVGARYGEATEP
jgi:hypothetical protein